MTVDLIDSKAEQQAVGVVKQAIEIYNEDEATTPSQALIKASQGHDFTPDMLCRLSEAFNSSAQLAHLESADKEKRADAIPLVDPIEVVNAFFDEKPQSREEKVASVEAPVCYDGPERQDFMAIGGMEKAASEPIAGAKPRQYQADPGMIFGRIDRTKRAAYRQAEIHQTEAQMYLDKVAMLADRLINYFRSAPHLPFEEVEKRASANFEGISSLLDHVYRAGNLAKLGEARAKVTDEDIAFIDEKRAPYSVIKEALDAGAKYAHELIKAAEILDQADEQYDKDIKDYRLYKQALVGSLGSLLSGGAQKTEGLFQPQEEAPPRLAPVIAEPEHEANMAAIEQRAALNDMMTNDPIIGAVDPQQVIQAFNRLSSTAPHVARDPNMLRSVLRRAVQQDDIDPFELKQLVDLDSALQKRDEPTNMDRMVLS